MDLNDKAQAAPDVTLAGDLLESAYEVDDTELVAADDLTPEGEFPQFGDFLPVREYSPYDGTARGQTHIEVPQQLAEILVERDLTDGRRWVVAESRKVDGQWQFEVEVRSGDDSE